jgi:hypothetical protein
VLSLLTGLIIALINQVAMSMLQWLASKSKLKTIPEEKYQGFLYGLICNYIDIALIFCLVNFDV